MLRSISRPVKFAAPLVSTAVVLASLGVSAQSGTAAQTRTEKIERYVGTVDVVRNGQAPKAGTVTGYVFDDVNQDSRRDSGEKGVAGALVSNGREVVKTDKDGTYTLPAFDNMTVFVTQPAGYQVPVDANNVAQFSYNHLPKGSPTLRFGGIAPTGELPSSLNFPMIASNATKRTDQRCIMAGDLQTYSNREIGFARDGAVKDLADRSDLTGCGVLFLGDVGGDDIGLYPQMKKTVGIINAPLRFLPGNHDLDFDATDDAHSFDTFRAGLGPAYFSYDAGDVHVIALDTVRYPCTPDVDKALGEHCADPAKTPRYSGRLDEAQMAWLTADLANTPKNKLIVNAGHIPLLSFADMSSNVHQVAQVTEIYQLLEGRKAVSLAGHTHSLENLIAGEAYEGWSKVMGVDKLPFHHIVAGAISGDWYSGDLNEDGIPMAFQRDGVRPGVVTLDVNGTSYREKFRVTGEDWNVQMGLGINSPTWRDWYTTLMEWRADNPPTEDGLVPPMNYNDLRDPRMITLDDLQGSSYLTANVWMGRKDTKVTASIDGKSATMSRTQSGTGEGWNLDASAADPYAATKQMTVGRFSFESTSGVEENQGFSQYRGTQYGPNAARPGNNIADRMMHLWRLELPKDLAEGVHHARVTATDPDGRTATESIAFTVVKERPQMEFRKQLFDPPAG